MKKSDIEKVCQILAERYAGVDTELDYGNHFQLLCAVALSAQATDKSVNKATAPLFEKIKTPEHMVAFGYENLAQAIKTIGLWRNKAKNIIELSEQLIQKYDSKVPNTREDLMSLAGVGRKTANVVLNVAFGQPTIAVDTHIFRVANRLGLVHGKNPDEVERQLERVIPDCYKKDIHIWLIMWGRYICQARQPKCQVCALADYCLFVK